MRPFFPWFGGKSRAAPLVWERFGNVPNYVEPFFGSGAVLLNRPHEPKVETVNDLDCFVANFFRATQHAPDEVAHWCDYPVNEADLHARHLWLLAEARNGFRQRMREDPDFFDAKIAGWWVWGQSAWIGAGWCTGVSSWGQPFADGREAHERLPHLGPGMGVHRPSQKLPHLGDPGRGVHRPSQQLPHLGNPGMGLFEYFAALADRLRRVRVCCGDWTRVLGPTPTFRFGLTGVFLDPPYSSERCTEIYGEDSQDVAFAVAAWARENGDNPLLRIALCGYTDEHEMLGWTEVRWKAAGGYGSQGNGIGRENATKETIWFSPHCLQPHKQEQQSLFSEATA